MYQSRYRPSICHQLLLVCHCLFICIQCVCPHFTITDDDSYRSIQDNLDRSSTLSQSQVLSAVLNAAQTGVYQELLRRCTQDRTFSPSRKSHTSNTYMNEAHTVSQSTVILEDKAFSWLNCTASCWPLALGACVVEMDSCSIL